MKKSAFLSLVLTLIISQSFCIAEPNDPNDPNSFRSRFRGFRAGRFRSERAVINWHDGIQQIIVSPRLSTEANSIWLFPIKAGSEQIKFQLTNNFLRFNGINSSTKTHTILEQTKYALIATQIWSLPISYFGIIENLDYNNYPSGPNIPPVDSNGTHIELLNADSLEAFSQQLNERGRTIPQSDLENYAKYLNADYSLLAVWREGNEPNLMQRDFLRYTRRPSVYVEFPAEKPFYLLTKNNSRLSLALIGYWQIPGQSAIECQQMVAEAANLPDLFKQSLPSKNIPFTACRTFREANLAPGELTFVEGKIKTNSYADTISTTSYIGMIPLGIIALAVISYLAAGFSGLLTYRKWKGFAEFGLWNIFTIIAMGIAMSYKKGGVYDTFRQSRWKPRIFLVIFSILVVAATCGLFELLKMPLQ